MTSRRLFLADCREDFKRKNWVFWLQILGFFICFPGALVLGLNSIQGRFADDPLEMSIRLKAFAKEIFQLNEWTSAFIVGVAILVGIQAFSWLHDKKQVNFYHSQPVSRNRRFLVIWFNGVAGFLAAYLINLILGLGVAASYGCLSEEIFAQILPAVLGHLLLFLSIFHITVVAVMLTGYTLVSLAATVVLLAYEIAFRTLICLYAGKFFHTYSSWEDEKILKTLFSPLLLFFRYQMNQNNGPYSRLQYNYSEVMYTMIGLVLLYGILGWLLYKRRASESHGRSISFPKIKEPLRVLLLWVFGAYGGLFVYNVSGSSETLGIAGAVFATLIGHALIQLVYEVDFKAVRKNLPGLGISLLLVAGFFFVFLLDLTGYDEKIPDREEVESIGLVLEERYWDGMRVLPDGTEVSIDNYLDKEMKLTDVDTIYQLLDNRLEYEEYKDSQVLNLREIVVTFRLKNGRTTYRVLQFDEEDNLEVFNEIFHMEEYQKVSSQVMEDNFVDDFRIFQAEYTNGRTVYDVPAEQVRALVEAYVKDVENVEFSQMYYHWPIGQLTIGGEGIQNPKYINQWRVPIYPAFTHTCALLEKEGILPEALCDAEYLKSIKSVSLFYKVTENYVEATDPTAPEMVAELVRKRIVLAKKDSGLTREDYAADEALAGFYLVEEAQLKELLDRSYLQSLTSMDNYGYNTGNVIYDLIVERYVSQGKTSGDPYTDTAAYYGEGYYSDNYYLRAGQMPEFLKEAVGIE